MRNNLLEVRFSFELLPVRILFPFFFFFLRRSLVDIPGFISVCLNSSALTVICGADKTLAAFGYDYQVSAGSKCGCSRSSASSLPACFSF